MCAPFEVSDNGVSSRVMVLAESLRRAEEVLRSKYPEGEVRFVFPLDGEHIFADHGGLFGTYLVSIFAPNHKAMPLLDHDSKVDFLHRQVLTSRNVVAHPVTDFWYGGLNYQIEHHLFPRMPRNRLRVAQPIIRGFCQEHSIAYHETGVLQSYREILQHLHKVGAPLREAGKTR